MRSELAMRRVRSSCRRVSRAASPCSDATAQTRTPPLNRANFSRSLLGSAGRAGKGRGTRGAALGGLQQRLELARRGLLVDLLDDGELARQAIESGLVDLPFAIGLIGLSGVAIKIAHHLGDRGGVAGIDLGLIFLGAP